MRRIVFATFWLVATAIVAGCSNKNEVANLETEKISLVAPNGERIAQDMATLKKETARIVAKQFGNDTSFKITDVEYASVSDGYLALINYELDNGEKSSYAISNSRAVLTNSAIDTLIIEGTNTHDAQWEIQEDRVIIHNNPL